MSTKTSLTHGQGFHLYSEMLDEKCIYLELKDVQFEAANDGVTVAIPLPIWEAMRAHTNADFFYADKSDEQLQQEVEEGDRKKAIGSGLAFCLYKVNGGDTRLLVF